jgi:hypothetical protein
MPCSTRTPPPGQIAAGLGISLDYLRQVLRQHPLPRPRHPIRRTLIPRHAPASAAYS